MSMIYALFNKAISGMEAAFYRASLLNCNQYKSVHRSFICRDFVHQNL